MIALLNGLTVRSFYLSTSTATWPASRDVL
jgi:hypothetical protein